MLLKLAVGVAALLLILVVLRWFTRTPSADVARILRRVALYGAIAILLLLAATGRMHWLYAAIGAVFAMLPRLIWYIPLLGGLYRRYRAARSASAARGGGQRSQVEARFLRMTLDHDSGETTGVVLEGRFRGARLHELALAQLLELLHECRLHDEDSARLLEAYLDRIQGDDWRGHEQAGAAPAHTAGMNLDEAYQVLGLAAGASEEEIIAAHRRLMQKLHPDRGGSAYLAARINQAKDLLIDALRRG
jgi:hypothetical protein